jgi:hypothetical protein
MAQPALQRPTVEAPDPQVIETTLLDLVAAVSDSAESEAEVIATISDLLRSGKIRLIGNFRRADVRLG